MSSTNVHSEQENNIQLVGGQSIPNLKVNEIEMPPKAVGKGPSTLDVMFGESMEILVGESELHKDGKLIAKDGTQIAQFDENAYKRIAAKHNRTKQKASTRKTTRSDNSSSKGEDR